MPEAVWAVVVARVGNGAKSRLAIALDAGERRRLTLSMLSDVLAVCVRAGLDGLVAVVDDHAASQVAERYGALVVNDPSPAATRRPLTDRGDAASEASGEGSSRGMNAAVRAGIVAARDHGATTVIVLPGDVPAVAPSDFAALLEAASHARRAVIVGASRDGEGTNALLLRPPDVIDPAFGPPSVERHVRLGRRSGAITRVVYHLGLALDIDTPSDLAALAEAAAGPRLT